MNYSFLKHEHSFLINKCSIVWTHTKFSIQKSMEILIFYHLFKRNTKEKGCFCDIHEKILFSQIQWNGKIWYIFIFFFVFFKNML